MKEIPPFSALQSDRPKLYSYLRFSTPEQSKGDSRRRQTDAAHEYAAARGLEVDETLSDEGVSAYRAKHVKDGQLGAFVHAIGMGFVAQGSVLLVENIDRLSRQPTWRTATLLANIVQGGVTVVTLNPLREYSAEALDHESNGIMTFIEVSLQAHRAHSESAQKGKRLRAVWAEKRARAKVNGEALTAICPPWLYLLPDRSGYAVHEERAKVVQRIFRDTLRGIGTHALTDALNAEGVPPFSPPLNSEGEPQYSADPAKAAKQRQRFWRRTYLATLLKNPAVIGERTLCTNTVSATDTRVKVKDGVVPNAFPSIISASEFQAVQAQSSTKTPRRGRHATTAVSNIFGGLAICGRCGSTVTRVNKGQRNSGGVYLVCENAKSGAGCRYTTAVYRDVEAAFILALSSILQEAPKGDSADTLTKEIANLEGYLLELSGQYDDAFRAMRARPSTETAATLRRLESERDSTNQSIEELQRRVTQSVLPLVQYRLDKLWDLCLSEPMDRTATNAAMRQAFKAVIVDFDRWAFSVEYANGGSSSPIIYAPHKAEAYGFTVETEGVSKVPRKPRRRP